MMAVIQPQRNNKGVLGYFAGGPADRLTRLPLLP